jgi:hypothetical protein
MTTSLYETDFYAWANEQAALLRSGRLGEADLAHIAEEIESMGKTEKRELVSRLTVLLLHLLKREHRPALRGAFWRLSVANARDEIAEVLADNPSLKSQLGGALTTAYRYARRRRRLKPNSPSRSFRRPARGIFKPPWTRASGRRAANPTLCAFGAQAATGAIAPSSRSVLRMTLASLNSLAMSPRGLSIS